ncbi:hypothetical protein FGO68_gene941 [Halteria grandinella]|uniref:Uncharacterized protein n=1 Tax=Halteria grandinella TaxID=5974 RepID=A0A8J8P149_HALGN|nr:hypothetical protein FGO68_gene941 [Halteria grandinella]
MFQYFSNSRQSALIEYLHLVIGISISNDMTFHQLQKPSKTSTIMKAQFSKILPQMFSVLIVITFGLSHFEIDQ